ncbi:MULTISPECIES: polyamine ABC transporter substrate-binding protein [unclassified Neisseria]|uniref:polyamine ABC transporter substrate-binding protein n=1 Tax=unclassified Neisseria TaxID=2623750 RepID=UPI0026651A9C|nr:MULTISPECIES: polyamine ABC transporter substrate-binding protein [unclassified Neisseria]MDO1510260.1 polyamine ABC transporter substrate-binding protein [Neisseria sp. MVDL19-042950]MDO1516429.1 polyamine ABC transporter substrate-binding protein [Neisseria sp. MVDL18-041461]MDO1563577.1 polyamine ABC transporter substrate-binding protein [Neisseria sp. MVDL20-010259]
MKKTWLVSAVAGLFLVACGGSGNTDTQKTAENTEASSGQQQTAAAPATGNLNIYNWSDYVDPATVSEFEKTNKIKVRYDYYDSNETLEAKVLTGKSGYDLVAPSIANVGRQIKAGAYQEIDKSMIANYGNIDPDLLKMMEQVDPGNKYAVPYFWGINTLAINKDQVAKALGSDQLPENEWDLVFNPEYTAKLKSCGISFLDSPTEQIPLALNYIGKDPNSETADDLKAAVDMMKKVRSDVKRFSSSGYIDDMAAGNLCVAVGYGGDLNIAKNRAKDSKNGVDIEVLTPKSGVGIWIDSFMIPKGAQNVANAHRYISYTLDPQVAAKNGNFVTYAPASKPARDLMEQQYAGDNSIFPSDEVKAKSFVVLPKSPNAVKLSVRLWQGLKAGQ